MEQEVAAAHLYAGKGKGEGPQRTAGHATTSGQDYEVALLCLVFLRALRLASDFFLLSNHAIAGKFDDVVFFYKLQGDREYRAILVQAKHRETSTRKRLTASNPFQLKKHLDSFAEIGDLRVQQVKVQSQAIEVKEVSIVLYSNTGCDFAGVADDVTAHPDVKHLRDFLNTGGRLLHVSDAQRLGLTQEFVDHLTLCVEQMQVETCDEHLERELADLLGLKSSSIAECLRKKLRKGVKRWWSERGPGRCLTSESREWKEVLEEQVVRLNGINTRLNLSFSQQALTEVRSVMGHRQSWITVADECQAMVMKVRLVLALCSSCLVLEAKFLDEDEMWGEVAALWGTIVCPTLVVDLSARSPEEFPELLEHLQKDLGGHSGRRLGVIAQEEPPDGQWSLYQAEGTWSILHPVTRDMLMSARVQLQGHILALRDILGGECDASAVMSDKVISALCDPAAGVMQLGVPMDSSSLDNYVPQCLQRTAAGEISNDELQKQETLVFSYNQLTSRIPFDTRFDCLDLSSLERINHIARTTAVFGEISASRIRKECCRLRVRGVGEDVGLDRNMKEFVPLPWLCQDKVVIVEGVPGVGKSTFVTMMCTEVKQEFPNSWVLRFDLAKHTAAIKGRDFSDPSDVTTFLLSCLPREQQQGLQRHLLKHLLFVRGNVFLFLDAFDEISPKYTAQCCRLLKGITSEVKFQQMVVTTRSVTYKELEQALGTKAFSLPVFSEEEQNLFMERFSKIKGVIIDKSKISFLRQAAGSVLETPLICRMAAEVLLYSEDQNLLRYKQPWIRVLLYKRFVKETIINRLAEKLELPPSVLVENLLESQSKEHLRNLEGLAVRKLFHEDQLSNVEFSPNLPDEKLGLVISDGESVDFQHRTFTEFFLGCWLAKNWEKCDQDLLRELLSREGWEFVSATLSWSLFEDFPLHLAVARGEGIQHLSPGTTDGGGRSLLHLAAMTRGSRLLVTTDEDLQMEDKVLGATPVRCAEICRNWEFLEVLIGKGKTLDGLNFLTANSAAKKVLREVIEQNLTGLFHLILQLHKGVIHDIFFLKMAANKGQVQVVKTLLEKGADANMKNENDWTALMDAAAKGNVEIVKILLENGGDGNIKNRYGNTALMFAVDEGHVEIVKMLLEKGGDVNVKDEIGWTALMVAANKGHVEIVKRLLEKQADANVKDEDGWTALMDAAGKGHVEIMNILLEEGVDANMKNKYGCTALMIAAYTGHVEIVKMLTGRKVATNMRNENGWTALMFAANKGHVEIVKVLLEKGVDTNMKNADGWTALMFAANKGHVEIVKVLLEKGVDANMNSENGWTALMDAANLGRVEIVKILLEKGADANMKNENGWTALMNAANLGHVEIVKIILEKGVDANIKNIKGWTALMIAADRGNAEIVKILLEKQADANMKDEDGWTAFMNAVNKGHIEIVKMILEKGVDANMKTENGWSALIIAANKGHVEIVKALLEKGVDTNMNNKFGWTALMHAAKNGHVEIVKLLAEEGVDTNMKNENGWTALMHAANTGHVRIVKILLEKGGNANMKNENGWTALMHAALKGRVEIVEVLLEKGVDANIVSVDGWTALMHAANEGHVEIVKILLEKRVDANLKDEDGWTALMIAVGESQVQIVKVLLEKGADTNGKDEDGWTALMVAANKGHIEIVKILLEKGADANLKDEDGWTALMIAGNLGHAEIVKVLLENGVDANVKDEGGWTALMIPADNGNVEIVKILLEKGAGANISNEIGNTALLVAANEGHSEVVKLLLQKGADPKLKDKYGNTALYLAAGCGNVTMVKLLLAKGVDPNVENKVGNTAVILAAGQGHVEVVKVLLDKEVKLNVQNIFGFTALMMAAVEGHTELAKELLDKGAPLNAKDKFGNTALDIAALQGHQDVVEVLQERSINQSR